MDSKQPHTSVTHFDLCLVMKNSEFSFTDSKNQLKVLSDFISSKFNLKDQLCQEEWEMLESKLQTFLAHAIKKYKIDCRIFEQFVKNTKNSLFLQNPFRLPQPLLEKVNYETEDELPIEAVGAKRPKVGRSTIPFDSKSLRGQLYASAKVRADYEAGAIILAASQQKSPLGQLVKKTKSPSGTSARLALDAISSSKQQGLIYFFNNIRMNHVCIQILCFCYSIKPQNKIVWDSN